MADHGRYDGVWRRKLAHHEPPSFPCALALAGLPHPKDRCQVARPRSPRNREFQNRLMAHRVVVAQDPPSGDFAVPLDVNGRTCKHTLGHRLHATTVPL